MNRDVCEHFNPVDLPCEKCQGEPMTTLRQAAQQALEAMEYSGMNVGKFNRINAACQALRAALAEPEQEPFCYHDGRNIVGKEYADHSDVFPLYTSPPQRPAEPVQEPVAWMYEWKHRLHGGSLNVSRARWPESDLWIETPLYAAPPQRKPLVDPAEYDDAGAAERYNRGLK